MQTLICGWLASIVRIRRPADAPTTPLQGGKGAPAAAHALLTAQLLNDRSSRSLLANVLDLEDDFILIKYLAGVKVNPPPGVKVNPSGVKVDTAGTEINPAVVMANPARVSVNAVGVKVNPARVNVNLTTKSGTEVIDGNGRVDRK